MNRMSTTSLTAVCALLLAACTETAPPVNAKANANVTAAPPTAMSPPVTTPPAVQTPPPTTTATTAADGAPTAKDSAALDPKATLGKAEESKSMPMAGHGNNHSSPSLEPDPKK